MTRLYRWLPRPSSLLALAASFAVAAWLGLDLSRAVDRVALIWPANGVAVALLLAAPVRELPVRLLALFATDVAVNLAWGADPWPAALAVAGANAGEIAAMVGLLHARLQRRPDPTRPGALGFLVGGAIVVAAFAALAAADALFFLEGRPFLPVLAAWFGADALGLIIVTPIMLALDRSGIRALATGPRPMATLLLILLPAAAALVTCAGENDGLAFLAFPPLMLAAWRLPAAGTALALILTAIVTVGMAAAGTGPFVVESARDPAAFAWITPPQVAQLYLACIAVSGFAATAGRQQINRLRRAVAARAARLRDSELRTRVLAESSSDIILRIGIDGLPRYISPAVTEMLGWSVAEVMGSDWRALIHPDDQREVRRMLGQAGREAASVGFRYRRRHKNGSYVWVETRTRARKDPATGAVLEYIANIRDVTAQKAAEEALAEAHARLAQLATTDGLTSLPNRRSFDSALAGEWQRARRELIPVSLLMIDVDCFKKFNDHFGHLAGDDCLRAVADAIRGAVHRAWDTVARFGGEEFAVLLPATDSMGAMHIAEAMRRAVRARELLHPESPNGIVTVSIGVATEDTEHYATAEALIAAADAALYAAKSAGRDRVMVAPASAPLVQIGAVPPGTAHQLVPTRA